MKIVAFILAFIVLALSVMPCADKVNAKSEGKTKTELSKADHRQSDQQQDDCSPFCTCTCCAGFSINHFIAAISTIPPYKSNPIISFVSSQTIEVAFPIWQPPQLV